MAVCAALLCTCITQQTPSEQWSREGGRGYRENRRDRRHRARSESQNLTADDTDRTDEDAAGGGCAPLVDELKSKSYSSNVEISPTSLPSSWALSRRRMILPLRVLGSLSGKAMSAGTAIDPSVCRTWSLRLASSSGDPVWPTRRITNALMFSPLISSGRPMTAASATAGWLTSAPSTSAVPMRWPATFNTSSARPTTVKYPSSSYRATSPVV